MKSDRRLVYSAGCCWWGWIEDTRPTRSGLPGCPHCGSVLFETDDPERWFAQARVHAADTNDPEYVAFLEWVHVQPECWQFEEARLIFNLRNLKQRIDSTEEAGQ